VLPRSDLFRGEGNGCRAILAHCLGNAWLCGFELPIVVAARHGRTAMAILLDWSWWSGLIRILPDYTRDSQFDLHLGWMSALA
jgi:hypothetical protein